MNEKKKANHQSYELIRDKILSGELASGTKITEEKLANDLGFSRTPIRESIRRLEYEGLIVKKKVLKPTEKNLRDIFQVRMLLESHAAKSAAIYASQEDLDALLQCVETGKNGSYEEIMEANERFHQIIVQKSGNEVLIDTIDRMQSIIYLFRRTVVSYDRPFLIEEHEEIYQAIRNREMDKAAELMRSHLQKDLDFCLHLLHN
ncbi:GntR family transcriptional regulator [Priestia filamentosa]|nr:GntR family transcriptional regulator [Priestia filamentosa]MDT3766037.1 GntR family transcriptional regulator [Priestia filamentosa]WCM17775.1 GntR family transcriptional regulator [Priestia filamentosa]SMF68263.1 DNA-binding transcriptional regulator, GntR family [Priestia filamentosa]